MSELGQNRKSGHAIATSVLPLTADIRQGEGYVSFEPNADIEGAAQIAKAANEDGLMLSNHVLSLKWEPNTVNVLRRAV